MKSLLAVALLVACRCGHGKQVIKVPGWPDLSAKVPLSSGVVSGDLVFVSGMAGVDMQTFKVVPGGVGNQTTKAMELISEIVEAGNSSMADMIECTVYLLNMSDFKAMSAAYLAAFPKPAPSRVASATKGFGAPGQLVEIQCLAQLSATTKKAEVSVKGWPDPVAKGLPFSYGIAHGDVLEPSGMAGFDIQTMKLVPGGVANETTQALTLIKDIVEAGGGSMDSVASCNVYMTDFDKDFSAVMKAYGAFFPNTPPAMVALGISGLFEGSVEIKCSASRAATKEVKVPGWPKPPQPFSHAVVAGNLLYVSGMVGKGQVGAQNQTKQALSLIGEVLEAGGSSYEHVVSCAVYLADMKDFAAMNQAYATFFPANPPSRITIEVASLPDQAAVEIQCTAELAAAHSAAPVLVV